MYKIRYSEQAKEDLVRLKRGEPKAFEKAKKFLAELMIHPYIGTGHPEPLKGNRSGQWSRVITKKHRLVYEVYDDEVFVLIISAYGHYGDK